MAEVIPFSCSGPVPELAQEVAALPYDVFSRREAAEEISHNPHSFLRIDKTTALMPPELDEYAPEVYETASAIFQQDFENGVFVSSEDVPAYFAYRLVKDGHSQTGIVACVSSDEYDEGVIKRHESTRTHKRRDRIRHIMALKAHTGPVFLTYRPEAAVDSIVEEATGGLKPLYDFSSGDGIRHTVWRIDAPASVSALRSAFASVESLYIADGHHRAAAAAAVGDVIGGAAVNFLAILFPADQLKVLDYNRVVAGMNGLSPAELLAEVGAVFNVEKLGPHEECRPRRRGEFGMFVAGDAGSISGISASLNAPLEQDSAFASKPADAGAWYRVTVPEAARPLDPVASLDVSILHERLIAPILGVKDPRKDTRISYVGGVRGLGYIAERAKASSGVAFALYPCSLDELFAVADSGRLMPPKSTWFEPKPRSGLFIHRI